MGMTAQEAERQIASSGDELFIGSVISRLAPLTPGVFYRSQRLIDRIDDELLSAAYTYSALTLLRDGEMLSGNYSWVSTKKDAEEMSVAANLAFIEVDRGGRAEDEAVATLASLKPEVLRKVLGRMIDEVEGLMVLQPDQFPNLSRDGIGVLMAAGRTQIPPAGFLYVGSHVFMAGAPTWTCRLRMHCAREGARAPRDDQSLADFFESPGVEISR